MRPSAAAELKRLGFKKEVNPYWQGWIITDGMAHVVITSRKAYRMPSHKGEVVEIGMYYVDSSADDYDVLEIGELLWSADIRLGDFIKLFERMTREGAPLAALSHYMRG